MYDNKFECALQELNLSKISFANAGTGSITTTQDFTTPTKRGEGYAMDLTVHSNTLADVDGVRITVTINGIEILKDVPAMDYSPLNQGYNQHTRVYLPFPSGVEVVTKVVNDQANAIIVSTNLYFKGNQ